MKFSDFLRWVPKKNGSESVQVDRREAKRRVSGGTGWINWASETGEAQRARVSFVDASENPAGFGFTSPRSPAAGAFCWVLPDGGIALPCAIRHVEKGAQGYRVGIDLELEESEVEGQGSSNLRWIDDGRVQSMPANIKNSGQGLIEVGLPANVPARRMVFLEGRQYACLAVCRGSRPDGARFIVVAEAASDSFLTAVAA